MKKLPLVTPRIKRMDSLFNLIGSQLSFSLINPTNVESEKRKFFKDKKYNPQFTYKIPDSSLNDYKYVLMEINIDGSSPVEKLFEAKRKELIQKIRCLTSVGTPSFPSASKKIYKVPDEELVKIAHKILKLPPASKSKKILRKEGIIWMRKILNNLNIKYRISSVDMVTSANVNTEKKRLELRKRERFSEDYFKRLIVHEIGTHVIRTENGLKNDLKIFRNGFPGYLETEEGLAAYNEFRSGLMTSSILRNYAGRVVAVDCALKNDFATTYKTLRKHFKKNTAWKLTLRAKRGLEDTSQQGAFTKDVVYLRGFAKVLKFSQKQDINKLYYGKIGIKDIKIAEELLKEKNGQEILLEKLLQNDNFEPSKRRMDEETAKNFFL